MSEREALLRAVCENPDDDTQRLVFADWLEENREEARAEFIRVQVESERYGLHSERGMESFFRERELLCANECSWRAELPEPLVGEPFVRGFVETATIGWEQPTTTDELERLFAATPLVSLTIYSLPDPGILAAVAATSHLRTLTIRSLWNITEDSLRAFLTKVDLRGLRLLQTSAPDEVCSRLRGRFKDIFVPLDGRWGYERSWT